MNRIDEKFKDLKLQNKTALITYICSGDPSVSKTEEIVYALEEAGVDIIELGIPFSDPLADGTVIQDAALRALSSGFKVSQAFECVDNIRKKSQIPIVFMTYFNTVLGYGREKFVSQCVSSGIDGLIIPDLPLEESDELKPYLDNTNIKLIPLVSLTSNNRIDKIAKNAEGFIYCVSSLGVTGERASFNEKVDIFLKQVSQQSSVPVCVGFGISTKEDVHHFSSLVDGVIIGSALVRKIHETNCNLDEIKDFISLFR